MNILIRVATGIGLAAPAGYNADLPLLIVAVAARFRGLIALNSRLASLTAWYYWPGD